MKPIKFTLQSSSMFHTPNMIRNWQHMAKTGDCQLAFLQMSLGFPQLPGLMVMDILEERLSGALQGESITFEWSGPLAEVDHYLRTIHQTNALRSACEEAIEALSPRTTHERTAIQALSRALHQPDAP